MKAELRVAFRTDASARIGIGHFMRCLTLADELRDKGVRTRFVCRNLPSELQSRLASHNHELRMLAPPSEIEQCDELSHAHFLEASQAQDAAATQVAIADAYWDWLIVDHYALDHRFERLQRKSTANIMVIDDIADRSHDCDLLLDQNLYPNMRKRYVGKLPDHCRILLGPEYALLRKEFRELRDQVTPRNGQVARVLVFLGGFDPCNLTATTIEALSKIADRELHVDVVIGSGHPNRQEIEKLCEAHHYDCHVQTMRIAELMATADLAIGAAGSASWERCCLGVPTIAFAFADNQRAVAETLSQEGACIYLCDQSEASPQNLSKLMQTLLAEPKRLVMISSQAYKLVDGQGCRRVLDTLMENCNRSLQARSVTENDEMLLLEWANDVDTRRNAFAPGLIPIATHKKWLQKRLQDPSCCRLYIIESSHGQALGQVRFERGEGFWEVHYSVAPQFRARGLGRSLLGAGLQKFNGEGNCDALVRGQVKMANIPSQRIFESLGFESRWNPDQEIIVYERSLC